MILYIIFIAINILIAWINKNIVVEKIKKGDTRQINHFAWAVYYCAPIVIVHLIKHDWFLTIALLLLHISIFPIAYNLFRGFSPFNLSKTSKALTDRILVALKLKDTEYINIGAFAISIILLIISILK